MDSQPQSETWSAPLLSPVQRRIVQEIQLVCDTAVIEGASLGDIRAATEVFCEKVGVAFEDAAIDEASNGGSSGSRIRYADDDDDADGPDNVWKPGRA
jgi:hypothetical protein